MPSTRIRLGLYMFAPLIGGAERYLRDLLRGLHDRSDFDTTLFYNDWPEFKEFLGIKQLPHLRVCPLRLPELGGGYNRLLLSQASSPKDRAKDWLRAHLPTRFRTALWLIRQPIFLERDVQFLKAAFQDHSSLDILHVINGGYPGATSALAAALAAQYVGIPVRLMSVCSTPYPRSSIFWSEAYLDGRLKRAINQLIVPARLPGELLVQRRGFNTDQWSHISYGVPAPPEPLSLLELPLPPDTPVVGMLSNLVSGKGHVDLLQTAALLRQRGNRFHIVIVGDGVLRPTLARLAEQLALTDCVTFMGYLPDVYSALARFDIVVLPSEIEGLPYVILEAMSLGKAIVASAVGGIPEAIPDGVAGLLIPPKNVPALASAVAELLAAPSLRLRLGLAAQVRYQESYTLTHMVDEHLRFYRHWHNQ